MEPQDPLSQLAGIHLPEAVGFWPPAVGWWILLAGLIITAVFFTRSTLKAIVRRKKLANALQELARSYRSYTEQALFENSKSIAGPVFLNQLNAILRRVALTLYPSANIASLSGADWLNFLDSYDTGNEFSSGCGKILEDGIYRKELIEALNALAIRWIEARYNEMIVSKEKSTSTSSIIKKVAA
jgi:hypothetical protein